jgi:hypothetical protein
MMDMRDKVYARPEFLEHFKWCEYAQVLWWESMGGTVVPGSLPRVCR